MSIMKRLFSAKALFRSLTVFLVIAAVYFLTALGLIFWPSPAPFAVAIATPDPHRLQEPATVLDTPSEADVADIAIKTRDGETLFARLYESGGSTSIVLMHGIASDSSAFEGAARLLRDSAEAEVITPDFRGHGRSGGERFDVEYIGQYEDDLEDIIRFIRRERPGHRVVVAGHSMGGGVAMRYALKVGAPVPDAYLLFAPNFGEGPTQRSGNDAEDVSAFVHFDVRRMIGIILLNTVAIHTLDHLPILYFNSTPQNLDYSYRAVMSAQPIRPNTSDIALQAVNSPLLVIVGEKDEVFEVARFGSFISENSDGETVVLPGLTHDGIVNDPATYEVVAKWFDRLP